MGPPSAVPGSMHRGIGKPIIFPLPLGLGLARARAGEERREGKRKREEKGWFPRMRSFSEI